MCPASSQISPGIWRNVAHNQEEIPSIETDLEMTDDGIRRELFYSILKIAIINMPYGFKGMNDYSNEIGTI